LSLHESHIGHASSTTSGCFFRSTWTTL